MALPGYIVTSSAPVSDVADATVLASTAAGDGASTIGIEDDGGYFTATTVEGALQEIGLDIDGLTANLADYARFDTAQTFTEIQRFNADIILISPNGHRWQVGIDDAGAIVTTDLDASVPIVAGNPYGLLLSLTYPATP